jgi:putative membrane protein
MTGWLGDTYPYVKSIHVIFVIFWMAGLFMLPRFLVYWMVAASDAENTLWAERCRRLRRIILTPGLIVSWAAGISLAFHLGFEGNGWLYPKLAIVLGLSGFHGWATATTKKFGRGERPYAEKTLRLANEIPSLATIGAVLLVIVKPF